MADLLIEKEYIDKVICGVDEVGRGCLAGDVYAASVIIPLDFPKDILIQINDSKKLTAKKREFLANEIHNNAIVGIGIASLKEIEELNILYASLLAMKRAVENLNTRPDVLLIDGNKSPDMLGFEIKTIIKGDSISSSIAAASIIAKVTRDKYMADLSKDNPYYGWERNAGYGTKAHLEALKKYGITGYHRKKFSPIKDMLND